MFRDVAFVSRMFRSLRFLASWQPAFGRVPPAEDVNELSVLSVLSVSKAVFHLRRLAVPPLGGTLFVDSQACDLVL